MANVGRMSNYGLIFFIRPYDRLYLEHNAFDWRRELDFKGYRLCGSQHLHFLGWLNLKVFALPQCDQNGFCASGPEFWLSYET